MQEYKTESIERPYNYSEPFSGVQIIETEGLNLLLLSSSSDVSTLNSSSHLRGDTREDLKDSPAEVCGSSDRCGHGRHVPPGRVTELCLYSVGHGSSSSAAATIVPVHSRTLGWPVDLYLFTEAAQSMLSHRASPIQFHRGLGKKPICQFRGGCQTFNWRPSEEHTWSPECSG